MEREVLGILNPKAKERFIDATLGDGGYSKALLENFKGVRVLGVEIDPEMLKRAAERLKGFGDRFVGVNESYTDLFETAKRFKFTQSAGVLLDFGVAAFHFSESGRGFSFKESEPLDMRFNFKKNSLTAADIINKFPYDKLIFLFKNLGQEERAKSIVKAIIKQRPIKNTKMLADLILKTKKRRGRIHPATKVFQALRIAVNDELENIEKVLPQTLKVLKPGGSLVAVSYHSLEDALVKNFMLDVKRSGLAEILTKKPVRPSAAEVFKNPKARSARLRALRLS